jgi:hypothetical protein
MAEAVLRADATVHIIATSREPLCAEGERIYPVPPLAVPAAEGDDPWQYAAIQLFVVRSRASGARTKRVREAGARTSNPGDASRRQCLRLELVGVDTR